MRSNLWINIFFKDSAKNETAHFLWEPLTIVIFLLTELKKNKNKKTIYINFIVNWANHLWPNPNKL